VENDKVNFTFSEAAKAIGKDRTTIYRHAKDGKFSWDYDDDGNKVISY